MKVAEFDTRLTPSAESLQFITTCSPLSNLDSDSDMDAEGDPDPECVKVPMVVGDETAATSCCVYPPNIDAEGDPDPQYFTNVPMVHDKVATTTSLGVDLPENLTFDSDVEEAPLSMDVDEETTELSEPMMVTGNNLNEGSSSIGLNQNSTLISHLEMNVPSKLRTQILEYWSHHLRSRKHTIEAEKLWAEKYSAVVLGNCVNCKPGKACILETGRAKCTNCIKKKQLCSHMSTFKIEWIAGQLGTTLSAVQVVVDSVRLPQKQRPLPTTKPQEETATTSTKRRLTRTSKPQETVATSTKRRLTRTSKPQETATTSTKRRLTHTSEPQEATATDSTERRTSRTLRTGAVSSDNQADNQEASPVKKSLLRTSERLDTASTIRQTSRSLKSGVSSTPDAPNELDAHANAKLEAFICILEAEAAMKNAGCPEEVQGLFNGLMDFYEALFRR